MKLNAQQQQAVEYVSGPCLVLAGAGSGKTRVIINKIAYLIERCDYSPREIAAVTFTNKAAREMKERVAHSIGKAASKGVTISTFHTLGFDMIKREHKSLGFKANMTLFDEHDQFALLKELTLDVFQGDKEVLRELIGAISNWKMILSRLNWHCFRPTRQNIRLSLNIMSVIRRSFAPTMHWILMI